MENYFYKAKVSYKGSRYLGWQVQKEGQGETVQGQINKALRKIFKSDELKTVGSGRTDTGVHALEQVFRISAPFFIKESALTPALNSLLPSDIQVLDVQTCSESFHPIFSANAKEYIYTFSTHWPPSPFFCDSMTFLKGDFDFLKMEEAAKCFVGKHIFKNFYCEGTPVSSYEREIFECSLSSENLFQGPFTEKLPPYFLFRVKGSGFLKQMVRLMVGAVWEVGKGKLSLSELKAAIACETLGKVGPVAPAQGLYLNRVFY